VAPDPPVRAGEQEGDPLRDRGFLLQGGVDPGTPLMKTFDGRVSAAEGWIVNVI
jgi:hypothetical protein